MRYAPDAHEIQTVETLSDAERMEYFLIRIAETEEVWSLQERQNMFRHEVNGQWVVPFWPYRHFARTAALEQWQDGAPQGMSLEHFIHPTLQQLIDADLLVEIMPTADRPGCLITPHRLLDILVSMQHAREYRLDADG